MDTTKSLPCTFHIVTILNVCKLGIHEMFTKQCKSLHLLLVVISTCNFFIWQGGTPINKFPKPKFRKYDAHFELPKVKVGTIKLLHDFQGLHSKRRHFEHKNYNKHSLKLESWSFEQLEELSSKDFHLETWYFQKTYKTSFPHLKNLQHFEEISFTLPTHLERLLLSLQPCKLKAFPQKDSPFLCCTSKYFQKLKNKFSTFEKLTTLWRNLFHTSYSLRKIITLFATFKLKAFPRKDVPFLCCTSKTLDYFLF